MWVIKEEIMGGQRYWMIYRKWLFFSLFHERWNTKASAEQRIQELNSRD